MKSGETPQGAFRFFRQRLRRPVFYSSLRFSAVLTESPVRETIRLVIATPAASRDIRELRRSAYLARAETNERATSSPICRVIAGETRQGLSQTHQLALKARESVVGYFQDASERETRKHQREERSATGGWSTGRGFVLISLRIELDT